MLSFASLLMTFTAGPATTETALESIAGKLPCFQVVAFIYDRDESLMPKRWEAAFRKGVDELRSQPWPAKDLLDLLKHRNPRVRVLALAALFDKQDPKHLSHFAALQNDKGTGFPQLRWERSNYLQRNLDEPKPEDVAQTTVGEFAVACIGYWLYPAGYDENDVEKYLAETEKFGFRSSWYSARFNRVTGGISAGPEYYEERKKLFHAFAETLDRLKPPVRDWTRVWVASQYHDFGGARAMKHLSGEEAIVAAGKRLGPAYLRRVLRRESIAGDAELQDDERCLRLRERTEIYILRHAKDWLAPEDADELKKKYDETKRTYWILAAAALRPADASRWIRAAMKDYAAPKTDIIGASWVRARLAAGLARIGGEADADFIVDWYYSEYVPNVLRDELSRQVFLGELNERHNAGTAKTLARIIRDRRFGEEHPTLVFQFGAVANTHAGREIVARDDLSWNFAVGNPDEEKRLERVRHGLLRWADSVSK